MPDLVVKKVALRNWMTYQEASVEFPEYGIVWVTGSNIASHGKLESVGSGKTGLGEAICRTLCGVAGRFLRLGDYSTHKKGNLYVKLDCELHGRPLVIESGYRCPELSRTGEGLRFTWDGKRTERGHIDQTREELTQMIRVTPKLARWAVFIDGDKLKFSGLPEKDAVELVMSAMSQPPWTQWHEEAKKTATSFGATLASAEAEHENTVKIRHDLTTSLATAKQRLTELETTFQEETASWQHHMDGLVAERQAKEEELHELDRQLKVVKERLKAVEDENAEAYHQLEIARQGLQDSLAVERRKLANLQELKSTASGELKGVLSRLKEMESEPAVCPTCGKNWDKVHSQVELKSQRERVATKQTVLDEADRVFKLQGMAIGKLEQQVSQVDTKLRNLRVNVKVQELRAEAEEIAESRLGYDVALDGIRESISAMATGPDKTAVQKQQAVVDERSRTMEQAEGRVTTTAAALSEARESVKVVRYWAKAFGPAGIPNMVLKDAIEPLNAISRRVSAMLTGGTIDVSYSTSRELASGAERPELNINVANAIGSSTLEGASKGESGLTNLIVAETLSGIGGVSNRVGLIWYDEILNSQDPTVRQSILSYFKDKATRQKILIFVVDHHSETSNFADHILLVEKAGSGVTSPRWIRS